MSGKEALNLGALNQATLADRANRFDADVVARLLDGLHAMRVAIYARVSTLDQQPETSSSSCAATPRRAVGALLPSTLTTASAVPRSAGRRSMP